MNKALALLCNLIMFSYAKAEVTLPNVFGHGMVLQQEKPLPVWGFASAGEQVRVSFNGNEKQTVADAQGNWNVILEPVKASFTAKKLIIEGNNTIVLEDILVGEVWLCSGQSNMEYQMRKLIREHAKPEKGSYYPQNEVNEANNAAIRIFLVNRKALPNPSGKYDGWNIAKGKDLSNFSAPAYFFAKELNRQLKVPVGVISSAVSGSRIEPWVPAEAFKKAIYFNDKKVEGEPGKFFDRMIAPLAPFALRGFAWYQGETNCFFKETLSYTNKMQTLINSWRDSWKDSQMPFYFTQIAPHHYSKSTGDIYTLPEFREAQAAALAIKNTGMIITTDLVDDIQDIHPTYKWEIGRRLALQALEKTYNIKSVVADGPVCKNVKYKKNKALISYQNEKNKLKSTDGKALTWFEIAGKDGKFYPANAVIKGKKIHVSSEKVVNPKDVRFAWHETAQPNLTNAKGLPAAQFNTKSNIKTEFVVVN